MDMPLSRAVLKRRRVKRIGLSTAIVLLGVGAALAFQTAMSTSVAASTLRISEVRQGSIANTVNASGTVVPVREEQLPSPIQSRVTKVHAKAGQVLKAGDLIMELDDKALRVTIENTKEQISQQDIRIQTVQLDMDRNLKQKVSEIELLELDSASAKVKLERFEKLGSMGITSAVDLQAADLAYKRSVIQLRQLKESVVDLRRASTTHIQAAILQKSVLQKQLEQQINVQQQTQVRAPFDGMLTWVNAEEGAAVATGQLVAKVSELNNFRVEASVSDYYARYLLPGQVARVEYNGQRIEATVQSILPEIQNGAVKLYLSLQQPNHPALRHKLRVEAQIVTEKKEQALIVDAGAALNGRGRQEVFIVNDSVAEKRTIELGLGDGQSMEVLSGIKVGERIIVSDTSRWKHLNHFKVN